MPPLKSLDVQGRVLYAGTFSKTLFPALRMAYTVVPAGLTEPLRAAAGCAAAAARRCCRQAWRISSAKGISTDT